ncbi:IS66 family insertion sequence element accessory protein TnpA [Bacillus thuringiensis]
MKRHQLKTEWETYIQDYKNSASSRVVWCQKQNLPVHRLYYWLKKIIA